nr:hypothetical protein [uncultured Desulfobacter sp.]
MALNEDWGEEYELDLLSEIEYRNKKAQIERGSDKTKSEEIEKLRKKQDSLDRLIESLNGDQKLSFDRFVEQQVDQEGNSVTKKRFKEYLRRDKSEICPQFIKNIQRSYIHKFLSSSVTTENRTESSDCFTIS